jgi:hypothetical protein
MKPILYTIIAIILLACNKPKSNVTEQQNKLSFFKNDSALYLVTDTIIYDVVLKPPAEPETWKDLSLLKFNRKEFIDFIFSSVYSGKLSVYDHLTDKKLSLSEVKKIEKSKDFSRDKITKIQFNESWFIDTNSLIIKKKVNSIILGYEIYNSEGEIRGYKAVFKIKFE